MVSKKLNLRISIDGCLKHVSSSRRWNKKVAIEVVDKSAYMTREHVCNVHNSAGDLLTKDDICQGKSLDENNMSYKLGDEEFARSRRTTPDPAAATPATARRGKSQPRAYLKTRYLAVSNSFETGQRGSSVC